MEYASNGKANLGVVLGSVGSALGLLDGAGILGGMNNCGANGYVTRSEINMMRELADRDAKIADLRAENVSEEKMIELYKQTHGEIVALRDRMDQEFKEVNRIVNDNRREQDAWNASQSVANATITAAITANNTSIAGLQRIIGQITQVKVPNNAVCPGWGEVTVGPA